jgi:hypothetical protein
VIAWVVALILNFAWAADYSTSHPQALPQYPWIAEQSSSIAALVNKENFSLPVVPKFKNFYNTCLPNSNLNDTMWSYCSAVLLDEEHVLTAAHCVLTQPCEDINVVFDYKESGTINQVRTSSQSAYTCKEVTFANYGRVHDKSFDLAVIRLNRKVQDRKPIRLSEQRVKKGDPIFALGHPLGLPLRVQKGFLPEDQMSGITYKISMQVFAGLSGAPAFNERGDFLGLTVRGGPTFESDRFCHRELTCTEESCPWGDVQVVSPATIEWVKSFRPL